MRVLPEVMTSSSQTTRCIRAIVAAVEADDSNVRSNLISAVLSYPQEWQSKLAEGLKSRTDEDNPAVHLDDGTPFLSAPTKDEIDDDIPF
jgi:hypothetical protein